MFSRLPDPDHPYFSLPYQHQRDLVWSVCGPALLDCEWSPTQLPDGLTPEAHIPAWIHSMAEPEFRSTRLGLMFEEIWHQYLQHNGCSFTANLQIQKGKQTLGELDLLVESATQHWHFELALKFYLGFGKDWIGPNRRDYLADKIHHTVTRQLPLARSEEALQQLPENLSRLNSLALMRGCLFHPADVGITAQLPPEVNTNHWRGYWIHQSQARQILPDSRWFLLSKPQWISPACADFSVDKDTLLEHAEIHFRHLDTALCAVEVTENPQGKWCEQQRWLLMPDHWPSRT